MDFNPFRSWREVFLETALTAKEKKQSQEKRKEVFEDGIHISKNLFEPYVRVSVEVTDVETGIRLVTLDNVDKCDNQKNDFTHHEEIVYPFVL